MTTAIDAFEIPAELAPIREAVAAFVRKDVAPHARAWDEAETLDAAIGRRFADAGLSGIAIDEAHGGVGLSWLATAVAVGAVAESSGSAAVALALHEVALGHLADAGAHGALARALGEAQPWSWIDGTEGDASVLARRDRGWRISGRLALVPVGAALVVCARTDADTVAFVVPREHPSLRIERRASFGLRGLELADVDIDGELDDDACIAASGAIERARSRKVALVAAAACGIGRGATLAAAAYAKTREQFGQAIAGFQAIQWKLADAATVLDAAWLSVLAAARAIDAGRPAGVAAARAALASFAPATRACSDALQIHGGYGYTTEFPIERMLRDVRGCELVAGTADRHRDTIARAIEARVG